MATLRVVPGSEVTRMAADSELASSCDHRTQDAAVRRLQCPVGVLFRSGRDPAT